MENTHEKLFFSFKRLIHILTTGKKTSKEYGGVPLYKAEVHILEIIGKNPGITGSDIAKKMEVTKGAISQIISKLLKKDLMEKRIYEDNMRIHELHLTPQGLGVFEQHILHEQRLIDSILEDLKKCSEKDINAFTSIVDSLADYIVE